MLKVRSEAQAFVEEQGANLLFLAIGFLHWYESDSSEEARRAPLILVPCMLVRKSALELFHLEPTGDDVQVNMSLAAKLRTDFGIVLPMPDADHDGDAASWTQYLSDVEQAVARQPRWRVKTDDVVLGFFSFGKFLMYKDLDPDTWPHDRQPSEHAVMRRLICEGFGGDPAAYDEDVHIDDVITPGEVHFVKDADSSQTQAILEVRQGRNLVIQGPPGTGKSQTITNLIAELIGQNKTVLFVAEKMAALEVVKRRLDECHLGDAVLELHSHRATKTAVLHELRRSLEQGRPVVESGERDLQQLRRVQDELNAYCDAVATAVGRTQMPFSSVLGRLLALKRQCPDLTPLAVPAMADWTEQDHADAGELVNSMTLILSVLGRPTASALWGSQHTVFTPVEENRASEALAHGAAALEALLASANALSERLQLTAPASLHDVDVVCRAAKRAAEAPKLTGVQLSTGDWQARRDAIKALTDAGAGMSAERARWDATLIEAAWEQDLLPTRQSLARLGSKWWRGVSGDWRTAKRTLQGLAKGELPGEPVQLLAIADSVLAYQRHREAYEAHASLGQALFGAQWQGERSDWDVLDRISQWVIALHDEVGKGDMPQGIVDFLSGHQDASGLGEMAVATEANVKRLTLAVEAATHALALPASAWNEHPLQQLAERLKQWRQQLPQLHQMARFNALAEKFNVAGMQAVLATARDCDQSETLVPLLDISWYDSLVRRAYKDLPILARFDRLEHEHRIQRFRSLDLASIEHAQTRLATAIWQRKPSINQPGEIAVLRTEINKKRKHLPIRQLIDRAGRAIQQLKPVFMMSPMSIANFLPPAKVDFDVVIFDEASQVKAVDALGAILRGKQVIVVGDTRQMPPTDFFSRDMEQEEETETADMESILSLFKAKGCNERYLRWHYRSRHESLIAVSNVEFYDSKLVVFPAAGNTPHATGISFRHLPEALYDRGKTRSNPGEAKAVAEAVLHHARTTPHLSLGVATFSVAQRDRIEEELELLRRLRPETESFFAAHPSEPFFVKNLENIQGDERDAMFISIGYGRNESGRIAKEFGPLNRDGGHRRLNVLITRAKMAMTVFSNFRGDDLELDASAKHGVRALKNLLIYAETRELTVSTETGKATDSPFEDQVLRSLQDRGYRVEPQVGTAGYFIDLAVRDPEMPGRYVLAIECDGAAYHSAKSARDRDRLRQGVLEGLGWRFHRIWSTDWFRNAGHETDRVVEAIESARVALAERDIAQPEVGSDTVVPAAAEWAASATLEREQADQPSGPDHVVPYTAAALPFQHAGDIVAAPLHVLRDLAKQIVDIEAPVHIDVVTRRLMAAHRVSRAGARVVARVKDAVDAATREYGWVQQNGFILRPGQCNGNESIPVRSRSLLPTAERKIELISPEEIRTALLKTVDVAFSIGPADLVAEVARALGFGRATANITAQIESQLSVLLSTEALRKVEDGRVASAEPTCAT
ncbi:DNA helicase related protein [plant metagenome]|uniref:DNA helicase related protein n=1 Tax=plant metagenome TaxID=1297885 RepID=A0A484VGL4_9ZZZZ